MKRGGGGRGGGSRVGAGSRAGSVADRGRDQSLGSGGCPQVSKAGKSPLAPVTHASQKSGNDEGETHCRLRLSKRRRSQKPSLFSLVSSVTAQKKAANAFAGRKSAPPEEIPSAADDLPPRRRVFLCCSYCAEGGEFDGARCRPNGGPRHPTAAAAAFKRNSS